MGTDFRTAAWTGAMALAAAMAGMPGGANAQDTLSNPAAFRRPAIFVPPEAPAAVLKEHGERRYEITLSVRANGTVDLVDSLRPDDPEFRERLARVTKFWVFYPKVDPERCAATASQARVTMEFRRGQERPRVWLAIDPLGGLLSGAVPRVRHRPDLPEYPLDELHTNIQGDIFLLVKIGPDGAPLASELLLGLPPRENFIKAASAHALASRWDTGTAAQRCAAVHYKFTLQK